jgi:signal transduction histidine kinase
MQHRRPLPNGSRARLLAVRRKPTDSLSAPPMTPPTHQLDTHAGAALSQAFVVVSEGRSSREEFLARMSHELRTPLNAVIGLARVLENNKAGNQRPEDIHLLNRIRANGERLLALVDNVLEHSRAERGSIPIAIADTDVARITRDVVDEYRSAAMAKGLRLLAIVPESAPPVRLDPRAYERVLRYLVDNAVKFTGAGTVKVMLVVESDTGRPVRVVVSDTGIGIPASEIERVFAPFEQLDGTLTRRYDGLGLGLPLARELCTAMGCSIEAESEVRQGSRFTVRLPNS